MQGLETGALPDQFLGLSADDWARIKTSLEGPRKETITRHRGHRFVQSRAPSGRRYPGPRSPI